MKCPECSVENLEDSKFCRECATPLPNLSDASVSYTKTLEVSTWDIKPGSIVAEKYRIIDAIGRGGMGVVYKAEDIKLRRTVALKFLPPELTQDKEARERFIQEARAASALDHPNICTIYEIGETEKDQVFISMAFYEGESLKDKIKKGAFDFEEATETALQIAQGLEKAHEKGIVHRDIKPANIILTKDGTPKIVDFGLAKLGGEARLTKVGSTMGTVAYMSPQQARGEDVDHRSDIWALGVVLYEMVTGQLPFKGDHEQSVIYSVLNLNPPELKTIRTDAPRSFELITSRALEKEYTGRYPNMSDMIGDLKSVQSGMDLDRLSTARALKSLFRGKRLIIAGGILVASLIISLVLITLNKKSTLFESLAVLPLTNL